MRRRLRDALMRHNARERFHLVRYAMGLAPPSLPLDRTFREELGRVVGATVPGDAFAATDYQLIRLEDALYDTYRSRSAPPMSPRNRLRSHTDLARSVMDVDLLVVFSHENLEHIVLVEAKYKNSWNNAQLSKKADCLSELFDPSMVWTGEVRPSFVLLSSRPSRRVNTKGWPAWMAPEGSPLWMEFK